MYTLYHDKSMGIIKVKKASKGLQKCTYTDDVTYYNNNYYLCSKRKSLVEKAKEIKQSWVEEIEEKLAKVNAIEF